MWIAGILIFGIVQHAQAARCRALAIGGGNDFGAYEAGAVIGLIQGLPLQEAQWDIVTGIGVGATNALMLSMYPKGQEASAATKLSSFWTSFQYQSFYQDWVGGYVTGLLLMSGLYDSSPMKKTLAGLQTGSFARTLGVGATDLISSKYVYFQSDQQTATVMKTGIYASASDNGWFPIVNYNSYQLLTGAILYSADLVNAVNYCTKKGSAISEITVDVVLGSGKTITNIDASHYKTLQVLMRYFAINSYNNAMQCITNAKHEFSGLNIRTTIYPSQTLPSALYPYEYTAAQLEQQLNLGITDGKKQAFSLEEI